MADDRRKEVEMGAGLQESRLNQEFIDALKKHGPKVIYGLAAVVLLVYGISFYTRHQENKRDEAFAELDRVSATGSPDSLITLAGETQGEASVSVMARLKAATALMDSARMRLRPGVTPANAKPEDGLSEAQAQDQYRKAADELQIVINQTKDTDKHVILQAARWSLATAKMSLGEFETAKTLVKEYVAFAEARGMTDQVTVGQARLAALAKTDALPKMTVTKVPAPTSTASAPGDAPMPNMDAVRTTAMGNRLSPEGQKALNDILKGEAGLPEGWKRTEDGDILIPVRDEETGRVMATYTLSSFQRGAIDERWIKVLADELAGNYERAAEREKQIMIEEGLIPADAVKEVPPAEPVGPAPSPAPAPQ